MPPQPQDNESSKNLVLPYNENFLDVVPVLKKLGVKVIFSYNQKIKTSLIKNSPTSQSERVYKINCKDCNMI